MDLVGALDVGDLAAAFARLPVFPVFDLGYFVVSILYLKYEKGAVELSRQSPFASWVCAMLYCFGSYILADLLLGEAPVDYFSNNASVLLATAVWYLTFYCPLNIFYKCVSFLPVKLVFVAMKEVVRVRKIAAGVHHAHHQYHNGWLVMVIVGFVKGGTPRPPPPRIPGGQQLPPNRQQSPLLTRSCAELFVSVSDASQQLLEVFMTATHSHGSPFAPFEGVACPILFGSVPAGHHDDHHHHGGGGHELPPPQPPQLPAKSREELNEGTRKRKAKKAE
nr:trimeric intracellular cation channel type A [Zootoca vivipara]